MVNVFIPGKIMPVKGEHEEGGSIAEANRLPFRWEDGPVTKAMKEGCVLLLCGCDQPDPVRLHLQLDKLLLKCFCLLINCLHTCRLFWSRSMRCWKWINEKASGSRFSKIPLVSLVCVHFLLPQANALHWWRESPSL